MSGNAMNIRELMVRASATVLAMTAAHAADAQTADAQAGASTPTANMQAAPAAAPEDKTDTKVEDIVVTAQRRSERLLDVPIAVNTITESEVKAQGLNDSASIALAVPGLQLNRSINAATPFIRGVGSPSGTVGEEGSTAVYVDGVYNTNMYSNLFNLNGISAIEVLKGPQGTLFGRNAAAGAILISTRAPSRTPSAEFSLGYDNYQTVHGTAYATGPLSSTFSANISIDAALQDKPWGRSVVTGAPNGRTRYFSDRAKLLWEPSDQTRVTLTGDYYRERQDFAIRYISLNAVGEVPLSNFYDTRINFGSSTDFWVGGVSLRAEHDFKSFRIASITAFRKSRSIGYIDNDATSLKLIHFNPLEPTDESYQQDLQILSLPGSKVSWVVGVFGLFDKAGFHPGTADGLGSLATANLYTTTNNQQKTTSYAIFGQVTVPLPEGILPNTRLTLGARASRDKREFMTMRVSNNPALNITVNAQDAFPSTTFRVALDHKFGPDVLGYVSYNTGFKSGLYNLNAFTDPPVRPEKIASAEVGLKARMLDGKLQVEIAAFHYKRTDIQVRQLLVGGSRLLNAANGRTYGLDFNVQAVPVSNLNLTASVSLLDGKYTSFPNAPLSVPLPGTCAAPATVPLTGGNITCAFDATGKDFNQSPHFTGNLGASYKVPLESSGSLLFNAAFSYNSGFFWEADNRLRQNSFVNLNGGLGWTSANEAWSVQIWGRNLTGAKRYSFEGSNTTGDQAIAAPPRTFGINVIRRFGQ